MVDAQELRHSGDLEVVRSLLHIGNAKLPLFVSCLDPHTGRAVELDARAAEGPGVRLDAVDDGGGWRLGGTKPWCSLAGVLDAALVTAHHEATGGMQ